MKKPYTFRLQYFNTAGKWHTSIEVIWECTTPEDRNNPYMYEVFDKVRRLRSISALPGLASGTWDGPILVDCQEGYPELVLPEEAP